ncbi:MAG: hypothetical protein WC749_02220 [Dehalococcoidia bacterium]
MNKATEICNAIKAALQATEAIVHTVSIMTIDGQPQVHVMSLRDLEQIPGEAVFRELRYIEDRSHEASKVCDGVKFFCLVTKGA